MDFVSRLWLNRAFLMLPFLFHTKGLLITENIKCASISQCVDCHPEFCQQRERWTVDICATPDLAPFCRKTCTDCVRPHTVGTWSKFKTSRCSKTCGGGVIRKRRRCLDGVTGDPGCDPEDAIQYEDCNTHRCPEWSPYGDWTECSVSCEGGTRSSTRTCNKFGRDEPCRGEVTRTETCRKQKCPRWGHLNRFGPCTVTCGGGIKTFTRICHGGNPGDRGCDGNATTVQRCSRNPCGEWSDWSPCTRTCEGGEQTRQRGNQTEKRPCFTLRCPYWIEVGDYGACSKSCDGGVKTKLKICLFYYVGYKSCEGPNVATLPCNTHRCNRWSPWKAGKCSKTCDRGGTISRRTCLGGVVKGKGCYGPFISHDWCNTHNCPKWSDWSAFGPCSDTCGQGIKCATRRCDYGDHRKGDCGEGLPYKIVVCNNDPCPNVFSPWSSFTKCNTTCTGQLKTRRRTCPVEGECPQDEHGTALIQVVPCNELICYGSWSAWKDNSSCSTTCGNGTFVQTRMCSFQSGQSPCRGSHIRFKACNIRPCPSWGPFSDYTKCSTTCSRGTQSRSRACRGGEPGTGNCKGSATEVRACNEDNECPCANLTNIMGVRYCCISAFQGGCERAATQRKCSLECCQHANNQPCSDPSACVDRLTADFCKQRSWYCTINDGLGIIMRQRCLATCKICTG